MATLTAKAAGGEWGVAGTWEPEQVPTAADDVILGASSGSVKVLATAKARSIEAAAYKKTWTITNQIVEIGTSTSNGGLALKLGAGMTFTSGGGTLKFVSISSEAQKITLAGLSVPKLVFEGAGGKWVLQDKTTAGSKIELVSGELNTNGQEVSCTALVATGAVARALTLGSSVVKVTGAGTCLNLSGTELTFSAGTATVEVTDTTVTAKKIEGARAYSILTISGNNVEIVDSLTAGTFNANTARKAVAIKATLVEKSKTLTVTEGALPEPKEELKGASIPTGTTCVKVISAELKTIEMSSEATATVGSAEAVEVFKVGLLLKKATTLTVTTFATNGKEGELARIATNESGKAATITKASGQVSVDFLLLRDSTAAGTSEWYAGTHSTNVSGNSVWKFEAPPVSFSGTAAIPLGTTTTAAGAKLASGSTTVPVGARMSVSGAKGVSGSPQVLAGSALSPSGGKRAEGAAVQRLATIAVAAGAKAATAAAVARAAAALIGTGAKAGAGEPVLPTPGRLISVGAKRGEGEGRQRIGARVLGEATETAHGGSAMLAASVRALVIGTKTAQGEGAARPAARLTVSAARSASGAAVLRGAARMSAAASRFAEGVASLRAGARALALGGRSAIGKPRLPSAARTSAAGSKNALVEGHLAVAADSSAAGGVKATGGNASLSIGAHLAALAGKTSLGEALLRAASRLLGIPRPRPVHIALTSRSEVAIASVSRPGTHLALQSRRGASIETESL